MIFVGDCCRGVEVTRAEIVSIRRNMDIASCDYKEAAVNTVFLQKEELIKKHLFQKLM